MRIRIEKIFSEYSAEDFANLTDGDVLDLIYEVIVCSDFDLTEQAKYIGNILTLIGKGYK